jgi:hypothetical protein
LEGRSGVSPPLNPLDALSSRNPRTELILVLIFLRLTALRHELRVGAVLTGSAALG